MTTHDRIWLRHMQTEGLIVEKGFAHFRTWDVEHGPTDWNDHDVWDDIARHTSKNEISQAAALLRHYLEHFSHEICHRLRARVEFRGDAQFMLGDLLPSAISAMRQLLRKGKAAAQSWGKTEEVTRIQAIEDAFAKSMIASQAENWQINAAVHFNQWATLEKYDFQAVTDAFKDLTTRFRCHDCSGDFYVIPERGSQEALRCSCNGTNVNLVSKPKSQCCATGA
jgi:hypothetical protein